MLPANNLISVPRLDYQQIWPSLLLLGCLLLLVLIKVSSFSKVVRIVQSTFSTQALHQLEREELNPFRFYAIALNTFFLINLAFILYKINSLYNFILIDSGSFTQFSFFFFLGLVVIVFKSIVNVVLGYFTGEQKVVSEYVSGALFINQTFGLFLFPWIVLMELSPYNPFLFICAGCAIVTAATLLKWYRGVIIGLVEERIGFLQIFSYFCSLEILPVFVMVKYIIETF